MTGRQMTIYEIKPKPSPFDGKTYNEKLDGPRLKKQLDRVREYMLAIFPSWKSLSEISEELAKLYPNTRFPEASISARLRDLRKPKFGNYTVKSKRRSSGLWEYLVYSEDKISQPDSMRMHKSMQRVMGEN